jgi:hypothetical protein
MVCRTGQDDPGGMAIIMENGKNSKVRLMFQDMGE